MLTPEESREVLQGIYQLSAQKAEHVCRTNTKTSGSQILVVFLRQGFTCERRMVYDEGLLPIELGSFGAGTKDGRDGRREVQTADSGTIRVEKTG